MIKFLFIIGILAIILAIKEAIGLYVDYKVEKEIEDFMNDWYSRH